MVATRKKKKEKNEYMVSWEGSAYPYFESGPLTKSEAQAQINDALAADVVSIDDVAVFKMTPVKLAMTKPVNAFVKILE